MPTLVASCISVSTAASGLSDDTAWSPLVVGTINAADGTSTTSFPWKATGLGGSASPPAPVAEYHPVQTVNIVAGFDLSSIPATNVISAIRLRVKRNKTWIGENSTGACDRTVTLGGIGGAPNLASTSEWPVTAAEATYTFTPGVGGMPSSLTGSGLATLTAIVGAKATGPVTNLPFADVGIPSAKIDSIFLEVDHMEPDVVVRRRPNYFIFGSPSLRLF